MSFSNTRPMRSSRRTGRSPIGVSSAGHRIGVIGAGAFARRTILPFLAKSGATLVAVASEGGLTAAYAATRFGFDRAATPERILPDDAIDAVVIATRHSSHASPRNGRTPGWQGRLGRKAARTQR